MIKYILLISVFSILHFAYAQINSDEKTYPIDSILKECLDSSQNSTTAGMIECTIRVKDLWDQEMNKYYNLLMKLLPVDAKEELKSAQKSWLAFRDAEFSLTSQLRQIQEGTMWGIVYEDRRMEIVKQRATDLRIYYDELTPR